MKKTEIGFGCLILGSLVIYLAQPQWEEICHSKEEAQKITACELANRGSGDNWYVLVTDYEIENPMVAVEQAKLKLGKEKMLYMTCKMIPQGAVNENSSKLTVIKRVTDEDQARQFISEKSILGYAKPNQTGGITVLASDRKPSMSEFMMTYGAAATAFFISAIVFFVLGFRKKS